MPSPLCFLIKCNAFNVTSSEKPARISPLKVNPCDFWLTQHVFVCSTVLSTFYNYFLCCAFFPVVCFSNSIVSSMDTGAITVLIWVMPGTSLNAHSWSPFQAPPVDLTAMSTLPLHNQTGIRTKLLPPQRPSLNKMGISSCSLVFLRYLVHRTG